MNLADSPHAASVTQLLKTVDQETLLALARTATNNRIIPQDEKEAIEIILTYTPDLGRFFSYRRIKAQTLFKYLIDRNVKVDTQSSKIQYIAAVQNLWEKKANKKMNSKYSCQYTSPTSNLSSTGTSSKVTVLVKADIQSNVSVTVNNIYVNTGRGRRDHDTRRDIKGSDHDIIIRERGTNNDTSNPFTSREDAQTLPNTSLSTAAPCQAPVRTMRSDEFIRDFCNWYYIMINRLQPACTHLSGDTLREDVFFKNSSAEVYIYGATNTQRFATGHTDTYTLLRDIFTEFRILFSPNVENGVQAYASDHGLVKVLVCGTLHQDNSFVGVFEQEFGLVFSPVDRSWKIMSIKLNLKQTSQVTSTPSLPKSQLFEITI